MTQPEDQPPEDGLDEDSGGWLSGGCPPRPDDGAPVGPSWWPEVADEADRPELRWHPPGGPW